MLYVLLIRSGMSKEGKKGQKQLAFAGCCKRSFLLLFIHAFFVALADFKGRFCADGLILRRQSHALDRRRFLPAAPFCCGSPTAPFSVHEFAVCCKT
ncbi:hypothetical protein [Geobacillus sp. B4113_201601]|uniref:hypothetical protein n=1 Tax=Geobacillus sp. B4113_201601 TaxID=1586290 RepID=UPI001290344F|nr:hypothetical protein [Geobacillus sp. B4113_201601]